MCQTSRKQLKELLKPWRRKGIVLSGLTALSSVLLVALALVSQKVLDNIERALASAGEEESALKTGVEMVHRGLMETLKRMGVEAIDRLGEPFDPELENAVLQGGEDEGEPGTVCAVLQKGYRLGNRVLRHAMVKVVAG